MLLSVLIPTLVTVTQSHFIRVWTHNLDNRINEVEMSSDGRYLVAGTNDNLYMFDTTEENLLWDKDGENLHIRSLSMSSDGKYFVAGLFDLYLHGYVYYFNSTQSSPLWTYRTSGLGPMVSISSDGEDLVAVYNSYTLIVFEKTDSTPLWNSTTQNQSQIYSLEISSDGHYLIYADFVGNAYFFNNSLNPSKRSLWNYTTGSAVRAVAISNSNEFIAVGSNDYTVYLFDKLNSTSKNPLWNFTTQGDIIAVDFSLDEKYLVVASADDKVYLFETNNSIPLWSYLASTDILSTAISDDGEYVAIGDQVGNINILRSDTGSLVSRYKTKGDSYSLRISSNGDVIACAGYYYDTSISECRIYLFDRSNPDYGKDFVFVSSILFQNLLISGLPTGIISTSAIFGVEYLLKQRSIKKKELQEKLEEEELLSKLDSQFEKWDKEDKKR